MSVCKSTFTFLLKEGEDFEYQLEPFFLNTKSQEVEPLSASPNSTPRAAYQTGLVFGLSYLISPCIYACTKASQFNSFTAGSGFLFPSEDNVLWGQFLLQIAAVSPSESCVDGMAVLSGKI